jgi:hypothetical protein
MQPARQTDVAPRPGVSGSLSAGLLLNPISKKGRKHSGPSR